MITCNIDVEKWQVKVWLGSNADHYYVLSRFLVSRMLVVTKVLPLFSPFGGYFFRCRYRGNIRFGVSLFANAYVSEGDVAKLLVFRVLFLSHLCESDPSFNLKKFGKCRG